MVPPSVLRVFHAQFCWKLVPGAPAHRPDRRALPTLPAVRMSEVSPCRTWQDLLFAPSSTKPSLEGRSPGLQEKGAAETGPKSGPSTHTMPGRQSLKTPSPEDAGSWGEAQAAV